MYIYVKHILHIRKKTNFMNYHNGDKFLYILLITKLQICMYFVNKNTGTPFGWLRFINEPWMLLISLEEPLGLLYVIILLSDKRIN